jgi:hypothetical protein
MHAALAYIGRLALLFGGASLLVVLYLLPSYPRTLSGWLWMVALSVPYALVVGAAGSIVRRAWPPDSIAGLFASVLSLVVIGVATWTYLWQCGVL